MALFGEESTARPQLSAVEEEANALFGDIQEETRGQAKSVSKKRKRLSAPIKKLKAVEEDLFKIKFDATINLRTASYLSENDPELSDDEQGHHIEGRLDLGKRFTLGPKSTLVTSGWIELGNREDVYLPLEDSFDLRDPRRPRLNLNEFYYQENFGNFDITIGKKVVTTGKGIVYSPSDRITPLDTVIPVAPLKIGNFLFRYDYYLGDHTFTYLVQPWFLQNRTAPRRTRWTTSLTSLDLNVETEFTSGIKFKRMQHFFKYETTLKGWDLFVSTFSGPNPDPSIRNDTISVNGAPEIRITADHVNISNISAGFSTTFGSTEVHGETLHQNAEDGKDDSYTAFMLGFRSTFDEWTKKIGLNQIDWVLEYAHEVIRERISFPFYIQSSIDSRIYQKSFVGGLLFQVNDRLSFNYDYHFDLEESGIAQFLGLSYTFVNAGQIRSKLELFSGDPESLFGIWDNNDNLSIEYIYTF